MDEVKNTKICVPVVDVLYDFQYTAKDKREISMRKGEKLYLIEKTNKDWWQVVRQSERRSFYVPAQYVRVVSKEKLPLGHIELPSGNRSKKVEYENLNPLNANLRDNIPLNPLNKHSSAIEAKSRVDNELVKSAQVSNQKPVPKTRTKVSMSRVSYEYSSSGKSSVSKLPPSECDSSARYDVSRYGDKKPQDLSIGSQKKSDYSTHILNENDPCSYKEDMEEVKNVVPKARSKMNTFSENEVIESNKNRMKSSYNLRVKPSKSFEIHQKSPVKYSKKESTLALKSDARSLSRSLEKLAQEIKFQPKEIEPSSGVPALSHHSGSDEACRKLKKPSNNNNNNIVSNNNIEKKIQKGEDSQSKGNVFTRLRRSLHHSGSFKSNNFKKLNKNDKKACELSLSWEGGLDKALELEKNKTQPITPSGLQRSRTFMVAERSPTIFRHGGSIYQGRNRVDIAYHSQKPPEVKNVLSTFKPIGKIEEVQTSMSVKHSNDSRSPAKERAMFSKDEDMYVNAEVWESKRTEAYSQSESEDNSDVKCLPVPVEDQKAFRDRSSFDSNMTHSEGTEVSESDENGSLDLDVEKQKMREPLNKRRTSLMRNRRVSTTKSRTVTARQLPPTPTAEERPTKDLGNGWGVYIFDNKRNYYYNRLTGEKSWKPPRKNLSCQDNRYVGSRESICSDTSGSIIRSSTSSPSNDRILSNSLNRSNASLSSRSTGCDVSGYDLSKSNSGCNLAQNRSSLTSSPATGQSRSSSFSVIKSSRDSLNRCSPIENIPSEDDIELHDHVYQEDNKEEATVDVRGKISEEESKQQVGEGQDEDEKHTTGVPVPPGWTECYDDTTNQFFYIHKETKQKWFTSFDPEGRLYFFDELSNESSWALPDINAEGEDGKFDIQRSATESAIPKGFGDKLTEDGEKWRHRGSSTRSSKTQSMVIEPKLDFSSRDDGKTLSMPRDLTKIYGEIIRSGMLNKTKICENGKKLRKNWTPAFVVLSSTKLLFFKDAKTFHSMKPGNDCMCLNLQGAVIEKGDKISSKKNVYKVNSVDHTEVLIQTDRISDAEEWFKDILTVIQNLPQESINSSTSSLDPNSPSKVGRTKSVKARSKDGGSMEDLSLNSEERQNKIKAKLKKFFNRRPTVDSLKKKGIWKDEPVFGCSLEQITKNRIPRVPVFVEKCIECIESKEENLKTDGLYRASGNLSQVQKIRLEVDQNNLNILKEEEDVHVLTGSLKLFFRELKDPLIPFKQLVPALTAINNPKRKEKIKEYRKIVGALPCPNYDTLKFLLQHLLRVEKYNEFNRMNVNNLAIVFGPTLMWPEQESTNMALDFMQQNLVIECLLREFQEIFT